MATLVLPKFGGLIFEGARAGILKLHRWRVNQDRPGRKRALERKARRRAKKAKKRAMKRARGHRE